MCEIVLTTLNARYIHASLGLRYLLANLGDLRERSSLLEFTIKRPTTEIVDEILALNPRLVGFGVYIWNTEQTLAVVRALKAARPELMVVAGGPEISFETETQELFASLDFVFKGEADLTFAAFAREYLEGRLPTQKMIQAALPEISQLRLPYAEYSDDDLKNRVLYVEASRGCPYKCEYCLSALDVSVRNFDLDLFLSEMDKLIRRGARQFKFVDRTFNLAPTIGARILGFFLERINLGLFLHFEMVPDRLPEEFKRLIEKFPPGALQFEIGIQTWNTTVAHLVSRRQNYTKIGENLRYLHEQTGVHTHTDLIVGLPGENFASFAAGFDALHALKPDEIQVGLLKRLKGTPIIRHTSEFALCFSDRPPFQILSNRDLSAQEVKSLKIFADFWDLVANSGRFPELKELAPQESAFDFFFALAQSLFAVFGRTHSIHLPDLQKAVRNYLRHNLSLPNHTHSMPEISVASTGLPRRQARHL